MVQASMPASVDLLERLQAGSLHHNLLSHGSQYDLPFHPKWWCWRHQSCKYRTTFQSSLLLSTMKSSLPVVLVRVGIVRRTLSYQR